MIYIGQTCAVPPSRNSKPLASILLGKDDRKHYEFLLLLDGKLQTLTQYALNDVSPIRMVDKTSPTGGRINYGEFCRGMEPTSYKMKVPDEAAVIKHLTQIQKELDRRATEEEPPYTPQD